MCSCHLGQKVAVGMRCRTSEHRGFFALCASNLMAHVKMGSRDGSCFFPRPHRLNHWTSSCFEAAIFKHVCQQGSNAANSDQSFSLLSLANQTLCTSVRFACHFLMPAEHLHPVIWMCRIVGGPQ